MSEEEEEITDDPVVDPTDAKPPWRQAEKRNKGKGGKDWKVEKGEKGKGGKGKKKVERVERAKVHGALVAMRKEKVVDRIGGKTITAMECKSGRKVEVERMPVGTGTVAVGTAVVPVGTSMVEVEIGMEVERGRPPWSRTAVADTMWTVGSLMQQAPSARNLT